MYFIASMVSVLIGTSVCTAKGLDFDKEIAKQEKRAVLVSERLLEKRFDEEVIKDKLAMSVKLIPKKRR